MQFLIFFSNMQIKNTINVKEVKKAAEIKYKFYQSQKSENNTNNFPVKPKKTLCPS